MLLNVVPIIIQVIYYAVLKTNLYTDRAMMPNGEVREWQRSPIDRLYQADQPLLLYLQLVFAAVSVVASVLVLCGVKNRSIRTIQLISTGASTVMFIIILIVTGGIRVQY